jgi:hypothetical protein
MDLMLLPLLAERCLIGRIEQIVLITTRAKRALALEPPTAWTGEFGLTMSTLSALF